MSLRCGDAPPALDAVRLDHSLTRVGPCTPRPNPTAHRCRSTSVRAVEHIGPDWFHSGARHSIEDFKCRHHIGIDDGHATHLALRFGDQLQDLGVQGAVAEHQQIDLLRASENPAQVGQVLGRENELILRTIWEREGRVPHGRTMRVAHV